jgi:hypothetical protein
MSSCKKEVNKKTKSINVIFGSIAVILLIMATYLTLTHHHFAVTINMWQVKLTGDNKYFPVLTILLLALPPLLLLLLVKLIILKILKQ